VKRRTFMTLLGGAAVAWPLAARAQQRAMPVVGFLNGLSAGERPHLVESFRRGLSEAGYVAGQNVAVEYRYAENQPDRLQALAADLIARRVAVIAATGGNNPALVAKSLTTTIPIVFTSGADPVRAGLVSSFSQPEANVTGVSWFSVDLGAKHLELVRELVPAATLIAVIVNPRNREAALYEQPLREAATRIQCPDRKNPQIRDSRKSGRSMIVAALLCCGPTQSAAGLATWGLSCNKVTGRLPRASIPLRPT
jgi:putative ABC transport system substrate-binding protein